MKSIKNFFHYLISRKKMPFASLILLAGPNVDFSDKLRYLFDALWKIGPIVFLADQIGWWTAENQKFSQFMWIILLLNLIVGMIFHLKNNTFSWKEFLTQNILMVFVVGSVLVVLEMFRYTAGDNIAGEIFRWFTQTITLFYPASKIIKNCFILSNGQYPPMIVMKLFYNFEKNGDLSQFYKMQDVKIHDEDQEDFERYIKKQ